MSESVKYVSKRVKLSESSLQLPMLRIIRSGQVTLREWRVPMRSLPFWHLYWNLTPGARLIFHDHIVPMRPGKIYLFPSHTVFATDSEKIFEHCYVDFQLDDEAFAYIKKELLEFVASDYARQLDDCIKSSFSVLSVGSLILSLLTRVRPENYPASGGPPIDQRIMAALDKITAVMHSGQQVAALDNLALSRCVGMSIGNFQHLFQRELKISPKRYILNLRIDLAAKLLQECTLGIDEIATRTGFANRYHFSKSFRMMMGTSPVKFRNRSRMKN